MKPVIYIFLNKSLGMSVGKSAAQASHAAAMSAIQSTNEARAAWEDTAQRMVVVLSADDDAHLSRISTYLQQRGVHVIPIIDEGANEVEPQSWTALTTQILDRNIPKTLETFNSFRSYRDSVKVTMEINR